MKQHNIVIIKHAQKYMKLENKFRNYHTIIKNADSLEIEVELLARENKSLGFRRDHLK